MGAISNLRPEMSFHLKVSEYSLKEMSTYEQTPFDVLGRRLEITKEERGLEDVDIRANIRDCFE